MVSRTRTFLRLSLFSITGLAFYYAHLFLGMVGNAFLFKFLAVAFLLVTVPLPIIAVGNRKLFPTLDKRNMHLVATGSLLLLLHHFLMTFVFVMFLEPGRM